MISKNNFSYKTFSLIAQLNKKIQLRNFAKIPKTYVLGNTSVDLDSFLAAYLVAIYKNHAQKKLTFPLINCPLHELDFRFDITYLCKRFGVETENYFSLYDKKIYHDILTNKKVKIDLVDHNKPDPSQIGEIGKKIFDVYDHHKDEKFNVKGKKILTYPLGSCTTLVLRELFLKNKFLFNYIDPLFSVSAILIDTENFSKPLYKKKWIKTDLDVFKAVIGDKYTKEEIDRFYHKVYEKKNDPVANLNLGTEGILKKDKKNFLYVPKDKNVIRLGWSVFQVHFEKVLEKYGENGLFSEIDKICEKEKDNFYICSYAEKHCKCSVVYNYNLDEETFEELIKNMRNKIESEEHLEGFEKKVGSEKSYYVFKVHKALSRKHIEPIIRYYLNGYKRKLL